jgi:hypothetical protein
LKISNQKAIIDFFNLIGDPQIVTKSALTQARAKVKPELFIDLNNTLVNKFYEDGNFKKWNGFRLLSIDGSTLNLPYSKELMEYFGIQINGGERISVMARISNCYDLENEINVNTIIDKYIMDEYSMAIEHLKKAKEGDLLLFDRGYGALWLFFMMQELNVDFVTRISRMLFSEFWNSQEDSSIIEIAKLSNKMTRRRWKELGLTFQPFRVRLIKVYLSNGDIEVLATSLFDRDKYKTEIFDELYAKRWGVETEYNHLKNHVELENFSGKTIIAIMQDFYANIFIENIRALITIDANNDIDEITKNRKYKYKVNKNLSLGFLTDRIVNILLDDNHEKYDGLKKLFTIEPIPIIPDRHVERKFRVARKKFSMNYRRAV